MRNWNPDRRSEKLYWKGFSMTFVQKWELTAIAMGDDHRDIGESDVEAGAALVTTTQ